MATEGGLSRKVTIEWGVFGILPDSKSSGGVCNDSVLKVDVFSVFDVDDGVPEACR